MADINNRKDVPKTIKEGSENKSFCLKYKGF